jgi:hypothetical protein
MVYFSRGASELALLLWYTGLARGRGLETCGVGPPEGEFFSTVLSALSPPSELVSFSGERLRLRVEVLPRAALPRLLALPLPLLLVLVVAAARLRAFSPFPFRAPVSRSRYSSSLAEPDASALGMADAPLDPARLPLPFCFRKSLTTCCNRLLEYTCRLRGACAPLPCVTSKNSFKVPCLFIACACRMPTEL